MTIKFLKDCEAPQQYQRHCGDGCCSWPEWDTNYFTKDEEIDPEDSFHPVDITGLTFGVHYTIISYP
jgi:hypothetical protein